MTSPHKASGNENGKRLRAYRLASNSGGCHRAIPGRQRIAGEFLESIARAPFKSLNTSQR